MDNNINYPISNALALYECGVLLEQPRYLEKAKKLAAMATEALTEHQLLLGEGTPRFEKSGRGCYPVDIGYNVEETLPSLALYGILSGDEQALEAAGKGLSAHLAFLLDDGGWDNSFGTRNFKWTYWGSRTSDGCGLGYLLLADRHSEFALAAEKNLRLLKSCTHNGLLYGGPHYLAAGQPACVHHTFTHAKVLAGILDRKLIHERNSGTMVFRRRMSGIHHYPEVDSWIIGLPSMTATVTAYDWEYLEGGHVSGGTLSLLHHYKAGTLLCAGTARYSLKEPNNMQIPIGVKHECLALRIEMQEGGCLYSSIYEDCARVTAEDNKISVHGILKDIHHQRPADKEYPYTMIYGFEEQKLTIQAQYSHGILICPIISCDDEEVNIQEQGKHLQIQKKQSTVSLKTTGNMRLPYGRERIFNLVPGFQALRVDIGSTGGEILVTIIAS